MSISRAFYTSKKKDNIFLKFHHSLLRMKKSKKQVKSFLSKKASEKHNERANK